ncbi:cytochrome c oxidase assembly protein COX20, mitochondrial-like [Vespa mandarinia]|uniref:cytochrome c oxidase assembly protein COX20, mitochondrial-like n=1 Tax=Vespa mandarinia TaxID=7446 RepID=UPI00161B15BD|nr:cytochrome c oxidase assembly protein COX20, mitochondrial-like [Vespa mandarinia]
MQNDSSAPTAIVQREEDRKPVIIFGRNIAEIPCFRNSFLYGISSGIGGGLLAFLFTSRPKLAMHCTMATYFNVTIGYWFYCRYTRDLDHFNAIRMQDIFQNAAVLEGTEEGPEIVIDKELVDV